GIGDQPLPLLLDLTDLLAAELLASLVNLPALLQGELVLPHAHHLHCLEELLGLDLLALPERTGDPLESIDDLLLERELLLRAGEVILDDAQRGETRALQALTDLVEAEPERPQTLDLLEPEDILGGVEAVARARPMGRHEQADLLVVVQRPDGEPGALGE